jgi:arsenate reductase
MSTVRVYTYKSCDTCRKATRWLEDRKITFEELPIREIPPSLAELRAMQDAVGLKRLFNTSGRDYRAEGIKEKLPTLSDEEALALLHANGNLIKRPFLLAPGGKTTGFKESEWEAIFE